MKLADLFEAVVSDSAQALKLLGLASDASMTDVKASYRKLAQKLHPDKNDGSAEATEKMKMVNAANDFLLKHGLSKATASAQPPAEDVKFTKEGIKEVDDKLEVILKNPAWFDKKGRSKYIGPVLFARERLKVAEQLIEILPAYEAVMKKIVASWKNRFEKPEPFKAAAKEFEEFFKEHKPNDLQALLNRIAKRQRTAGCTYLKVETPLRNKVSDELSEILSSREKIKEAVVAVDRTPEQRERAAKASARMKAQWGSTF